MSMVTPMLPVDPSYARKLLHDLTEWSQSHGFKPHPDSAKIEPLFGTTDPATCDSAFEFGHGGRPLLIGDLSGLEWDMIEDDDDDEDIMFDIDEDEPSDIELLDHAAAPAPREAAE